MKTRKPIMFGSHVSVVPRQDMWDRVRSKLLQGVPLSDMGTDNAVLVEVTGAGAGRQVDGNIVPHDFKIGDIAVMNAHFVGRCLTVHGVQHWSIDSDRILATMNPKDRLPRIVGKRVLTKPNLEWAKRTFTAPGSILEVPFDDDGTFVAGNGHDPARLAYEEVVSVGPGVEGVRVGSLVSVPKDRGSTSLTVHGRTYSIVKANCIAGEVAPPEDRPRTVKLN